MDGGKGTQTPGVAGGLLAGSKADGLEKIKETVGPRYRLKLS
jgi:hypothetical protein